MSNLKGKEIKVYFVQERNEIEFRDHINYILLGKLKDKEILDIKYDVVALPEDLHGNALYTALITYKTDFSFSFK